MTRFSSLTVLFVIFLCSQIVYAETTIFCTEVKGLHEENGAGAYDQIINEILIKSGLATLKVRPPANAKHQFGKCKNCCLSPSNKNEEFYDYGDDVIKTNPMSIAKAYIFTAKGQKIINNISDLKGLKVGVRFGIPYGKTFDNAGLNIDIAPSDESNIKKLEVGRINAFVAYTPDIYEAFAKLGIPPYPHDIDNPIAVHEDCLVCREVPLEVINKFNNGLKEMSESGQLKNILKALHNTTNN